MTSSSLHQEPDEIAGGRIVRTALIGLIVGGAGVLASTMLLETTSHAIRPMVTGPSGTLPARAQISEIEQTPIGETERGITLRNLQKRELERWGWIDRDAGIATIPIETAMDIIVRDSP